MGRGWSGNQTASDYPRSIPGELLCIIRSKQKSLFAIRTLVRALYAIGARGNDRSIPKLAETAGEKNRDCLLAGRISGNGARSADSGGGRITTWGECGRPAGPR